MIARNLRSRPVSIAGSKQVDMPPSGKIEAAYFVSFLYTYLSPSLGISINMLGAAMLAGVAALCIKHYQFKLAPFYALKLPVAFAVSFVAVQVLVHGYSPLADGVRDYITAIFVFIVMHSLSGRPGFFHRFMALLFLIGVASLPFLVFQGGGDEVGRAAAIGGAAGLGNANSLAAWFGFCAVYFMVLGLEGKRDGIRLLSWVLAAGCLFVIGLTVSRGTLLAVVLAGIVVFRRLPNRGLLPISILILGSALALSAGVYRQAAESYAERATEETGRLLVWPVATERFLSNALTGVGLSNIESWLPGEGAPTAPHNVILSIGLASGIIPLIFYIGYWLKAASGTMLLQRLNSTSASYYLPTLTYIFVIIMLGNEYMAPWVIFALAGPLHYADRKPRHQHWRTEMPRSRTLLRRPGHQRPALWQR